MLHLPHRVHQDDQHPRDGRTLSRCRKREDPRVLRADALSLPARHDRQDPQKVQRQEQVDAVVPAHIRSSIRYGSQLTWEDLHNGSIEYSLDDLVLANDREGLYQGSRLVRP